MSADTTYHNALGAFSGIIHHMLGQLLITLLVIVLAVLYVRKRALREKNRASSNSSTPGNKTATTGAATGKAAKHNPWRGSKPDTPSTAAPASGADLKVLVIAGVAMATMLGATLYFLAWQDARSSVTVILHRDNNSQPVIYEVRKRDLGERSFKTVDGTHVRVSANERIEIIGL